MRTTDRTRGVTLRALDRKALSAQALGHLRVMVPDVDWTSVRFQYDYAAAQMEDGKMFVLCTEGVGWEVTAGRPLVLEVAASWQDETGTEVGSLATNAVVYLSPYELGEQMKKGEDIDLADFIREFGSRLESNFARWHFTLTNKEGE